MPIELAFDGPILMGLAKSLFDTRLTDIGPKGFVCLLQVVMKLTNIETPSSICQRECEPLIARSGTGKA